jgi:hypothetical protein
MSISHITNGYIYKRITLHKDIDNVRYFIETEYGVTNSYVHIAELMDYIQKRVNEGTIVEINPTKPTK